MGYGAAEVGGGAGLAMTAELPADTSGPGPVGTAEVLAGLEAASVVVGDEDPADDTHAQTALAEAWTARPVWAPQPERTQLRAPLLMASVFLHWQVKSVGSSQPALAAALSMHWIWTMLARVRA